MVCASDRSVTGVRAREVLDYSELPTVQVDVLLADGALGPAEVPAGRSTGAYAAKEIRDGGSRYGGFGVRRAVANMTDKIGPAVTGMPADCQRHLGGTLRDLDGTPERSASGANALLGVSMAAARAAALSVGIAVLTAESGIQIVGDDLFVTNLDRLRRGIEQGAANALLWNVNQVGTLSEALDAAALATGSGFGRCVSEWSGETEDPIIADLVVALGAGQIKIGALVRGERTANPNGLLQLEEELGSCARYPWH